MMDERTIYAPPTVPLFDDPAHPLRVTGFHPGYVAPRDVLQAFIDGMQADVTKRTQLAAGKRKKSKYGEALGVGARQSGNLVDHPDAMSADQARAFAAATCCTIEYLRGEASEPDEETASADLVARYYESLPPELRKSVWAMLKAAHESTIYERFAKDNPGMIYDPLADDAPA